MTSNQERARQLMADSRFAFMNGQYREALNLAKEAIQLASKEADAYQCAGNACMSLEDYDNAIDYYKKALKLEPNNGNRYFNLGYAYASAEKAGESVKNLAKAEELGCTPENTVQLYNLLGIICFDIGRYNDALVNLSKAEAIIGIDMDIMRRKAIIYGMKNDVRKGLEVCNQMKLIAPSEYTGYQYAFRLLCQAGRLEAAKRELSIAARYAAPSMDYYMDCVSLELRTYEQDKDNEHMKKSLALLVKALDTLRPSVKEVAETYISAAELWLQLEDADRTIECLNAALNPVSSFNHGFEIVPKDYSEIRLTEYDVEEMIENDRIRIENELGEYGLEELADSIDPDEEGSRDFLTVIGSEEEAPEEEYKLDGNSSYELTPDNTDQVNRLYVGAYTLKSDFAKVIDYARKLQSSESAHNRYIGIYSEANACMKLGTEDYKQKYEETIKFFRNAMIKDPSDITAVTFRIQCCTDIGEYGEAEQLCNLLTPEIRKSFLEKVKEAKGGGE
ncbi:tetratricopeptide repeat protein [Ruminococcus flavefaciens]|uniref:tetratricopeptide repeat protein n=1 Tax=Ruminococcus flavefaciens TaxID=1265 RepID=UPI00048A96BB|nr:tetratricopeptide repeat protein [Ruminococcus flavefaciens]